MEIRLDGDLSIGLLVTPLRRSDRAHSLCAVVMVSDPRHGTETWESLLARIYGLTPTERQVVLQLLEGEPIEAIARQRRITRNTCRTHVKRVFAKVGARSQADLVRVLLGGRPRPSRASVDD
jgi:DNA-binding CsgD family transcriptional regulator